jgi:putative transposase
MPRTARASAGGYCYHVLNRGNARAEVFHHPGEYHAFLDLLGEASLRTPMRLLAYCLMPNHFHLVVWPRGDGDLSRWMHWLLTAHVRRYLRCYHSSGHVWQGRFKAFPIQEDDHLLTVLRYVERNPLRAGLVPHAADWPYSSLHRTAGPPALDPGPVPRGPGWADFVQAPLFEADDEAIRDCLRRDRPWGGETWVRTTAAHLGLTSSLRPRGRPPRPGPPAIPDGPRAQPVDQERAAHRLD